MKLCTAGGPQDSVTILYCAWSFVAKKCSKTRRNAVFLLFSFLRSSAFRVSRNHLKLTKKLPEIGKKGGLGWFWGLLVELLEAFGPQDGPKLKHTRKSDFADPPLPTTR